MGDGEARVKAVPESPTHPALSGFTEQDGMQLYENPFVL